MRRPLLALVLCVGASLLMGSADAPSGVRAQTAWYVHVPFVAKRVEVRRRPPPAATAGDLWWEASDDWPLARPGAGAAATHDRLYVAGGGDGVEEYDPRTGRWATLAPMPTLRHGVRLVAAENGRLYALGGRDGRQILDTVEEYNPAARTWATRAPLPTARSGFGVAALNGRLYAVGGELPVLDRQAFPGTATVEEYDPATDTWTARAGMPTPRGQAGVVASQGRLYAMGGNDLRYERNVIEAYDPGTDVWTGRKPAAFGFLAGRGLGAASNGRIYAVGGASSESVSGAVDEYDPIAETWTRRAGLPTPRARPWVVELGSRLFVGGGFDQSGRVRSEVETAVVPTFGVSPGRPTPTGPPLTSTDLTWSSSPALPTPRARLGLGPAGGTLYAIGGWGAAGALATVEELDPRRSIWTARASMPTARDRLGVVTAANGRLYAIGGRGVDGRALATVEEYDPATKSWRARSPLPTARSGLGAALGPNGRIYAVGGESATALTSVEEYDPETDRWTVRAPLPERRTRLGLAVAPDGRIYAVGGAVDERATDTVAEYDPGMDRWTRRARVPTARSELAVVTGRDGRLYAIGGLGVTRRDLSAVEAYDPATDRWTGQTNPPARRSGLAAAAVDGRIFVAGGEPAVGAVEAATVRSP